MDVRGATISYGLTETIPGQHSNVRVNVELSVVPGEGEDAEGMVDALMTRVREQAEAQVDQRFIVEGIPPKFYRGQRYKVLSHRAARLYVLIPDEVKLPGSWTTVYNGEHLTWEQADKLLGARMNVAGEEWICHQHKRRDSLHVAELMGEVEARAELFGAEDDESPF